MIGKSVQSGYIPAYTLFFELNFNIDRLRYLKNKIPEKYFINRKNCARKEISDKILKFYRESICASSLEISKSSDSEKLYIYAKTAEKVHNKGNLNCPETRGLFSFISCIERKIAINEICFESYVKKDQVVELRFSQICKNIRNMLTAAPTRAKPRQKNGD